MTNIILHILRTNPKTRFSLAVHLILSKKRCNLFTHRCLFGECITILKTLCLPIFSSKTTRKCLHVSKSFWKLSSSTTPSICLSSVFLILVHFLLHETFVCLIARKRIGEICYQKVDICQYPLTWLSYAPWQIHRRMFLRKCGLLAQYRDLVVQILSCIVLLLVVCVPQSSKVIFSLLFVVSISILLFNQTNLK